MQIQGKYATATVMTDEVEQTAVEQITTLLDLRSMENAKVVIMPDVHAGKGSVVGFTAVLARKDAKVVPNFVGVDIGCSVSAWEMSMQDIDYKKLDDVIKQNVPSGKNVKSDCKGFCHTVLGDITKVCADLGISPERHMLSVGSLGGGNHFIEVAVDYTHNKQYLIIHTGSRNFGKQICEFHQNKAINYCKSIGVDVANDFAYLEGADLNLYLEHMSVAQEFAKVSHSLIAMTISDAMDWGLHVDDYSGGDIFTQHNYIEELGDTLIIRKGAVSAKKGELFTVPISMGYGSLICEGKGNDAWNSSCCHGAGRVLSRGKAKKELSLENFQEQMLGVYSSSINEGTLDESPSAYKNPKMIIGSIQDAADILAFIRPVYNFKP